MKPSPIITLVLALLAPLSAMGQPSRILFGDQSQPVVSGEIWLIANRWGVYQGVLVGTIRRGAFEHLPAVEYPQYWEQAVDYKLLLAVSDQPVEPPKILGTDDPYGWFDRRPEYLKHFSTVYLSPPLGAENRGKDWPTALLEIGHPTGEDLILAPPTQRRIRLLYPDGKPLAGAWITLSLYGSSSNHCGVAVGITLGRVRTNADGQVSVMAPNCAIAITIQYFEEEMGGPTGTAFGLVEAVIIGGEQVTTVKRLWTLPEHDYAVSLRTAANQPIAHARLEGCLFQPPCMSGCGPLVHGSESDASGVLRFRYPDLREMGTLTVVTAESKKRDLTDSEMRELLTTYQVRLVVD